MKLTTAVLCITILVSGCGENLSSREEQQRLMQIPGYRETKIICTQCHKLPMTDLHVSAAWPSVIARMENYIRVNKRRAPTEQEREAIIGFFQSAGK